MQQTICHTVFFFSEIDRSFRLCCCNWMVKIFAALQTSAHALASVNCISAMV
jgi:hypothetical protein